MTGQEPPIDRRSADRAAATDRPVPGGRARSRRRSRHRPAALTLATVLVACLAVVAGCTSVPSGQAGQGSAGQSAAAASSSTPTSGVPTASASASGVPTVSASATWPPPAAAGAAGSLAPGSDAAALPGPVLIADEDNNRLVMVDPRGRVVWVWPRPGDLAPGQSFVLPDDAFFTRDGKHIVVTQEENFVVTVIDIATRKIVWRYGRPGTHGSGPGLLWNPDDAMMLDNGDVIAADIKNCRLVRLRPGTASPVWTAGHPGACRHAPPGAFGSPNGVFPLPNGHFLVTEINGDWVDEIDLSGHVYWSAHPPAVTYPSDTSQYKPGQYVTVDYAQRGQVVVFDAAGRTVWRWDPPSGAGRLNHPSLAEGLPNGDILVNDDRNHRVIVIDPHSNRIVWQYGHTGVPGAGPGYLNNPDGLDLAPPSSYLDRLSAPAR